MGDNKYLVINRIFGYGGYILLDLAKNYNLFSLSYLLCCITNQWILI